jgi:YebC/PmpR family DNA-binding regulatory protein
MTFGMRCVFLRKTNQPMGRAFEYRKARKMARWSMMARQFTRIGKEIAIAAKEGGPDPDTNPRLRLAMQNAKAVNMPKDNVEAAIKRATSKTEKDLQEIVYEGFAPHGVAVMVETATDNPTRTVANVRLAFAKNGGSLGTSNSVGFMFDHKASFTIKADGIDLEELELDLIDHGLEETHLDEGEIEIIIPFVEFGNMQKALDARGYEVIGSSTDRVPHNYVSLSEAQKAEVMKVIDMLEDDDDVQQVFHSMEE